MKRIFLFLLTNIAVLAVLSLVVHLLGLDDYLRMRGANPAGLLAVAAIFGFGGALISLALSKWMAKRAMGLQVIEQPANAREAWLVNTVKRYADQAGIGMPEVAIFDAAEMNAFATGARRDKALVAVSAGLLSGMRQEEAEAVIGHEVSHIANGDMVTLTLIQGVLNTFVFFISRIVGDIVDRTLFRGNDNQQSYGPGPAYFLTVMVAQIVLGILASMIVMAFSRYREFRADAGGAHLAGTPNMIGALERLRIEMERRQPQGLPEQMRAFGISAGGIPTGLKRLFMSHPPLEERIAALQGMPSRP